MITETEYPKVSVIWFRGQLTLQFSSSIKAEFVWLPCGGQEGERPRMQIPLCRSRSVEASVPFCPNYSVENVTGQTPYVMGVVEAGV